MFNTAKSPYWIIQLFLLSTLISPAFGEAEPVRADSIRRMSELPVVHGFSDREVQERVNNLLREVTETLPDSFLAEMDHLSDIELIMKGRIRRIGSRFLSATVTQSMMGYPLAHPFDNFQTITIDTHTQRAVALDELFQIEVDLPVRLKPIAERFLPADYQLNRPYEGIEKNQMFYLTGTSLVLFYPTYSDGPRPAGPLEIAIPLKSLRGMLAYPNHLQNVFRHETGRGEQGVVFKVTEESYQGSASLSQAAIDITPAKGEAVSETVILDGTIDNVWFGDGDKDGNVEILILERSAGSGSYADVRAFEYEDGKLRTTPLPERAPEEKDGYMGHDRWEYVEGVLKRSFPVYRKDDPNNRPTGGTRNVEYSFKTGKWVCR